jgi:hypothetical protein
MSEVKRLRRENKALRKGLIESIQANIELQLQLARQNTIYLRTTQDHTARPGVEGD